MKFAYKKAPPTQAFSLIETVIALGIFAFCIVTMLGLLPVGMRASRSVADEANALHIASSIFAARDSATTNSTISIPSIGISIPAQAQASQTVYFDYNGIALPSASGATLAMRYESLPLQPPSNTSFQVNLFFTWPVNAPAQVAQQRTFSQTFNQ
jgi:uncharacterized protein (TIGR02598 family)